MDLHWQEQRGEAREPGEPAKAEWDSEGAQVGAAKAFETFLKRKTEKDDFFKVTLYIVKVNPFVWFFVCLLFCYIFEGLLFLRLKSLFQVFLEFQTVVFFQGLY